MNRLKILDFSILVLAGLFLIGFAINEYKVLGLEQPLIKISHEWKLFFEYLIWPFIGMLVLDLGLKYKKTKNPKKFVKKYWIDIVMLALIPVLAAFKFFKLGVGIAKKLKTAKTGAKVIHKTKKVSQK